MWVQASLPARRSQRVCLIRLFDRKSASRTGEAPGDIAPRSIRLALHSLPSDIVDAAAREGLTVDELIGFSLLYYLADLDSGRVVSRISRPVDHHRWDARDCGVGRHVVYYEAHCSHGDVVADRNPAEHLRPCP